MRKATGPTEQITQKDTMDKTPGDRGWGCIERGSPSLLQHPLRPEVNEWFILDLSHTHPQHP